MTSGTVRGRRTSSGGSRTSTRPRARCSAPSTRHSRPASSREQNLCIVRYSDLLQDLEPTPHYGTAAPASKLTHGLPTDSWLHNRTCMSAVFYALSTSSSQRRPASIVSRSEETKTSRVPRKSRVSWPFSHCAMSDSSEIWLMKTFRLASGRFGTVPPSTSQVKAGRSAKITNGPRPLALTDELSGAHPHRHAPRLRRRGSLVEHLPHRRIGTGRTVQIRGGGQVVEELAQEHASTLNPTRYKGWHKHADNPGRNRP